MKAEEGIWNHEMLFSVFLNRIDDILKEEKVKLEKDNPLLSSEEISKRLRKKEEELYPAPCFYSDIILTNRDKQSNENNRIAFSSLSSGEKQIVNFLSTVIYQFYNISSRWEDKEDDIKAIKYKYINLIMDEIELYCHPKFQMFLIDRLINTIEVILSTQYIKGVNVILSTHSPFILSDIPKQNILGLKNGVPDGLERSDNTFCSNIYDILNDGFFLDKFVGDFAERKFKEVLTRIDKRNNPTKEETKDIYQLIDLIGDSYLKENLRLKMMKYESPIEKLINERDRLTERLRKINEKIKEEE